MTTPTFIDECTNRLISEQSQKEDEAFIIAFGKLGFVASESFIKEHCTKVVRSGDKYEHIWYNFGQQDAVRIISIEKEPRFSWEEQGGVMNLRIEKTYY